MILYVETNFVLELAYLRETSEQCRTLLALANEGEITLVIPSFALVEARLAWQRNVKRRNRLHDEVRIELGELSRSQPLADIREHSKVFADALIDTADQDRSRLESAVGALVTSSQVEPITSEVVVQARDLEYETGLSPQDAIVYATILRHLKRSGVEPKVFATQNTNDFLNPRIRRELAAHNCQLFGNFKSAEGYIRSIVK